MGEISNFVMRAACLRSGLTQRATLLLTILLYRHIFSLKSTSLSAAVDLTRSQLWTTLRELLDSFSDTVQTCLCHAVL